MSILIQGLFGCETTGLLGARLCGCYTFLWSGGDVHWYNNSILLSRFWRTSGHSSICPSTSNGDSQWSKWDAKAYTRASQFIAFHHLLFLLIALSECYQKNRLYLLLLQSSPTLHCHSFFTVNNQVLCSVEVGGKVIEKRQTGNTFRPCFVFYG